MRKKATSYAREKETKKSWHNGFNNGFRMLASWSKRKRKRIRRKRMAALKDTSGY